MARATKTQRTPKKRLSTVALRPTADHVVIRPTPDEDVKRGGLFIPDTAKGRPQRGEVMALGPGRFEESQRIPIELTVGNSVLYGKFAGTEVTIAGEELLIMNESDVLAVLD